MNRTLSGASIALLMGTLACSKQQQDTSALSAEANEPAAEADTSMEEAEPAADPNADLFANEDPVATPPEWVDPNDPRCGHQPTDPGDNKFVCLEGNSCKGMGICKTQYNRCACFNKCKGYALWFTKTREECEDPGGKVLKELG
jgi:hypothetical protein